MELTCRITEPDTKKGKAVRKWESARITNAVFHIHLATGDVRVITKGSLRSDSAFAANALAGRKMGPDTWKLKVVELVTM